MKFESLKEKCEFYRARGEQTLLPGTYVLAMLDGRSFSKMIKKKFKLPFDDRFIEMMNNTAKFLCENVQGVKLAYVQSDEISLVLTDFDVPGQTDSFFGYRNCKMLSIMASMATAAFNKELLRYKYEEEVAFYDPGFSLQYYWDSLDQMIDEFTPVQFDCKVWNVPTYNDVFAWFLYRQIDCIRNSKQQVAQSHFSHKELEGLNTDELIQKLKDEGAVDWWHDFDDGKKFGRYLWKEKEQYHNEERNIDYERSVWKPHFGLQLTEPEGRKWFEAIDIPRIEQKFKEEGK